MIVKEKKRELELVEEKIRVIIEERG